MSSTSSSWRSATARPCCFVAAAWASASLRATKMLPSASYHAGMRCPHHSWRLMHQSWMLFIHWKYVLLQLSGTKRMRPSSTARIAGSASGAMRTYHWSVSQGSSTSPERSPRGTGSVCASTFSSSPAASKSATTRLRASKRSSPR